MCFLAQVALRHLFKRWHTVTLSTHTYKETFIYTAHTKTIIKAHSCTFIIHIWFENNLANYDQLFMWLWRLYWICNNHIRLKYIYIASTWMISTWIGYLNDDIDLTYLQLFTFYRYEELLSNQMNYCCLVQSKRFPHVHILVEMSMEFTWYRFAYL